MKLRTLLAACLLPLLLLGCATHNPGTTTGTGTLLPTVADQVDVAAGVYEATALGVEFWATFTKVSPAESAAALHAIAAGRAVIQAVRDDLAAGRPFDLQTALRAIRAAGDSLLRDRAIVVKTNPRARELRAPSP